ncbi:drug/metabolite transporter (DMT)-like permease [Mycoplana sp. BE70]|uniref:hypothetical protein n=1 Tax=Mycoplana sp. BE70 TaxID=2817775 RepID=UPI00285C7CE0|nr:hypothetical protein [Mycoplana sp. BE70]MDR6754855.1 drug/metabolite transporter (DMT)-like permease [Mycoplana sp. BE70]
MWKFFSVLTIVMTFYGVSLTNDEPVTFEKIIGNGMALLSCYVIFGYAFKKNVLPRKTAKTFAWLFSGYLIVTNLVFIARLYEKYSTADTPLWAAVVAFVIGAGINYIEWLAVWRYGNDEIDTSAQVAWDRPRP